MASKFAKIWKNFVFVEIKRNLFKSSLVSLSFSLVFFLEQPLIREKASHLMLSELIKLYLKESK